MIYHLTVPTDKVRGKQRPRVSKDGHVYTPKATRDEEKRIRDAWVKRFGATGLSGALAVSVTAHSPAPKSWPNRLLGSAWTTRVDCDNVAKLCLDSLNGVAWADDAQIIRLHVEKAPRVSKTERARYEITVETLDE